MFKPELLRHHEVVCNKPKSSEEHRAEFTEIYKDALLGKETWEEEEGEIEGRVYELGVGRDKRDSVELAKFRLKARQSGFRVVDRIEILSPDYSQKQSLMGVGGGGTDNYSPGNQTRGIYSYIETIPGSGYVFHQFHLEGKQF